jgi:hypothetical protein
MELPAGWEANSNATLIDVADERAWISSSFDGTTRAFNTVTFTEAFTDGGAFATTPYTTPNAAIACRSGVLLLADDGDPAVIHRVTVTGPTTFTDATITASGPVVWANVGSYRRRWMQNLNKVVVTYEGGGSGELGGIIDVAGLTAAAIATPMLWSGGGNVSNNGIFWDPLSGYIVGTVSYNDGSAHYGIIVINSVGVVVGVAALDASDWDTGSPAMPLGGTVLASSLVFSGGGMGAFDLDEPTDTPSATYEATSFVSTPSGEDLAPVYTFSLMGCIAPRRPA